MLVAPCSATALMNRSKSSSRRAKYASSIPPSMTRHWPGLFVSLPSRV